MEIRVSDHTAVFTHDIDLDARWQAVETDKIVNRCVAAVTESLKAPCSNFSDFQRGHLSQVFFSMRYAHHAIRELLRPEQSNPTPVQVMPLVRSQLETLFAVCMTLEDASSLDVYLKDGWKKMYIHHLLARKEGRDVPRIMEQLNKHASSLEQFRVVSGVSEAEKQTIKLEELGVPFPMGFEPKRIAKFPSPIVVVRKTKHPDRKAMLKRLYAEYQFLCGFVHFSPASRILSIMFDDRQFPSRLSTSNQKYEVFQGQIAGPALGVDLISVVQSAAEFVDVYPGDIELVRTVTDAWKQIADKWLLAQVIWNLRARKLLGALS